MRIWKVSLCSIFRYILFTTIFSRKSTSEVLYFCVLVHIDRDITNTCCNQFYTSFSELALRYFYFCKESITKYVITLTSNYCSTYTLRTYCIVFFVVYISSISSYSTNESKIRVVRTKVNLYLLFWCYNSFNPKAFYFL